jgi:hypothetical protein
MATTIISTTRTTAVTLAIADELLVSRSGAILFAGATISGSGTGSSTDILINGEIASLGGLNAIGLTMTTSGDQISTGFGGHSVTISNSGSVQSITGDGVRLVGRGNTITNDGAIYSENDGAEVIGRGAIIRNTGTIIANEGAGIRNSGDNAILTNSGRLEGSSGIVSSGFNVSLVNAGNIVAKLFGIVADDAGSSLLNSGDIIAGDTGIVSMGAAQIINNGTISARTHGAVFMGGGGTFANTGLVQGHTVGVESTSSATVTLTNMGSILGNGVAVSLLSGRVVNSGALASGGEGVVGIGTAGGAITVQNGGTITAGTNGIHMDGVTTATIRNDGRIEAGDTGILIRNAAALPQIAVRSTGEIAAETGIEIESNGARVTNTGVIQAATGGIFVTGSDAVLRNAGSITADTDFGIFLRGDELLQILNAGTITATGDGIGVDQSSPKFSPAVVRNGGMIQSDQVGVHSVGLDTGISLRNTGMIEGDFRGVSAQNGNSTIVNIGTIAAGLDSGSDRGNAVQLGTGADSLRNTGTILGQVQMGAGNDSVTNGGRIEGTVFLGDGNDLYQARGAGRADEVLAGLGNDTLRGGDAADRLSGEGGNDLILGGAGDDTLAGGSGRDTLTGDDGADLFVFRFRSDASSGSQRDSITDFTPGQDRIDLSGFMAGAVFLGTAAYTATGARELRYSPASGILWGDIDGDGQSDWGVQLTTGLVLSAADFVL